MAARERLGIGADYYSLVFCSYIKYYRKKYLITNEQRSIFFNNAILVFFIQSIMFSLYLFGTSDRHRFRDYGFFLQVNFDICLTRFTNCLMMHMLSEPEIRQALMLWKYALNHAKVRSSMVDLYTRTCGDRFPLPEDPTQLTPELLEKAFKILKKYQVENKLACKHPIDPEVEFLLTKIDS